MASNVLDLSSLPSQISSFLKDLPNDSVLVGCSAPVNIAVIKYWGKSDTVNIIPINSSLSASIDQDSMCSTTAIIASKQFTKDRLILNGKEEEITSNKRLVMVLSTVRSQSGNFVNKEGKTIINKDDWPSYKLFIVSYNNFPTAAGLASSASGFACLAFALGNLFGFVEKVPGELSILARLGSGSACRSIYGGWVEWFMGKHGEPNTSVAIPHFDNLHWPDMRILILVANSKQKETSSTDGMQRTVATSELIKYRAEHVVPQRMKSMVEALKNKNFEEFGNITMADSNQFHSVCLDTLPPIFYMNDTSKQVISLVHAFNESKGHVEAAYTFDAGPNAVVFTQAKNLLTLYTVFKNYFNQQTQVNSEWTHDPTNLLAKEQQANGAVDNALVDKVLSNFKAPPSHLSVTQCIVTKVGDGPRLLTKQSSQ